MEDELGTEATELGCSDLLLPCDTTVCNLCIVESLADKNTALNHADAMRQAAINQLNQDIENLCTAHSEGGTMQGVCTMVEVAYKKLRTKLPDLPPYVPSAVLNHVRSIPVLSTVDTKYLITTAVQEFRMVFGRNNTDAKLGELYVDALKTLIKHEHGKA